MLPPVTFVLVRRYRRRLKSCIRLFLSKFSLHLTQSAFLLSLSLPLSFFSSSYFILSPSWKNISGLQYTVKKIKQKWFSRQMMKNGSRLTKAHMATSEKLTTEPLQALALPSTWSVQICHHLQKKMPPSPVVVWRTGWQAKMASIEFEYHDVCTAYRPH